MVDQYDVIVLGLGAMGSSALYQLSKRGAHVLGIDQYSPPHDRGSTHGETRITRLSNGESANYTKLVRRSHAIWREIERETGETLLTQCGGLIIAGGSAAKMHVPEFFEKTLANAKTSVISHQILSDVEIREQFPVFNVPPLQTGYFEPEAGFVRPEACIRAQLRLAAIQGAEIRIGERALGFEARPNDVTVMTTAGTYGARTVIASLGSWMKEFPGVDLASKLTIRRQVLHWFKVEGDTALYEPGRFPIFIWALPGSEEMFYGFPILDPKRGLKVATEQSHTAYTTDSMYASVTTQEQDAMRAMIETAFPGLATSAMVSATCPYTETPDKEFLIGYHSQSERVILVSACSGHGFKHSPAIGEAVAELALLGKTRHDLDPFRLDRPQPST